MNDATIMCHNCNTLLDLESPKDVIREHYWIGSTDRQSRYIFDQHLFTFYDLLQKNNPGLSECGFLKTLEQFSEIKGRVWLTQHACVCIFAYVAICYKCVYNCTYVCQHACIHVYTHNQWSRSTKPGASGSLCLQRGTLEGYYIITVYH